MDNRCKVPLCKNSQEEKFPICMSCLRNSVRRFMHAEGSMDMTEDTAPDEFQAQRAYFWTLYIVQNIDSLVKKEQEVIDKYGPDYDRDSDVPHIRVLN